MASDVPTAEKAQNERMFIAAVMDTVVRKEVGALDLRVRDMVTLAEWLAPVVSGLLMDEHERGFEAGYEQARQDFEASDNHTPPAKTPTDYTEEGSR